MRSIHIDHGNPMNALRKNLFTDTISSLGEELRGIKTIFILSAHWNNRGIHRIIGSNPQPTMIYDMYGFPPELYKVDYPVGISTESALYLGEILKKGGIPYEYESSRGIDHGIWSVLIHLFPDADIPIVPISLPYDATVREHYDFGSLLSQSFPEDTYLFISSGNIVHNLSLIDWSGNDTPLWASAFDRGIEEITQGNSYDTIIDYLNITGARIAVPTPDHFFPFVSFLGASGEKKIHSVFQGFELGSISQRIYKNF